jgi:hypothetical protein
MQWRTLIWLTVYAIAMAQVEAALVIHLRTIYYGDDPLALFPLVFLSERDFLIELAREVATILMISSVALLPTRRGIQAFGAFIYVFGLWDIGYYLWLKIMLGWPTQWLEWDVLFLIPWPWLGPWITPAFVSVLFVGAGARLLLEPAQFTRSALAAFLFGAALALTAFLLPGLPLLTQGESATFVPGAFAWSLFVPGYLLMALGLSIACSRRASPQRAAAELRR